MNVFSFRVYAGEDARQPGRIAMSSEEALLALRRICETLPAFLGDAGASVEMAQAPQPGESMARIRVRTTLDWVDATHALGRCAGLHGFRATHVKASLTGVAAVKAVGSPLAALLRAVADGAPGRTRTGTPPFGISGGF